MQILRAEVQEKDDDRYTLIVWVRDETGTRKVITDVEDEVLPSVALARLFPEE